MEAACLRSPLLAHWAGLVVAACRFLELDCHAATSCDAAWLPLSLAAAVILLAAVAGAAAWRWLAAAQARDGARMVAVAATVLKELRKVAPQQYPAERHMFMLAAEGTLPADPLQPLLCAVCLGELGSASGGPAPAAQVCAACGTLAHDGCVRGSSKTCRPLCCTGAAAGHSRQQHFWQAWGTVLDEESAAADGSPTCLYCQEPAETDGLVAAEPLWRCSLCSDACHVSCFAEAHPHLPTVATKLHALLSGKKHGSDGSRGQSGQASPQRRQRRRARGGEPGGSSVAGSSPSGGSSDDGEHTGLLPPAAPPADSTPAITELSSAVSDSSVAEGVRRRRRQGCSAGTPSTTNPAAVEAAAGGREPAAPQARPRSSSWLQALAGMVSRRSSSSGSGAGAGAGAAAGGSDGAEGGALTAAAAVQEDSGYSSDTESDDEFDARLQRQRWQRRRHRRLASQDIARLDECTLGPNRRSVLPPTAVRLASRSREGSQTGLADKAAAAEAAAAAASGGHAGGGAAAHAQQAQQADGSAGAAGTAAAAKEAEQGRGARRDGHKKGSSWWRRLYRKKGLQWSDYRIDQLPPGCKPVLVFVNTKSGPQVGTSLRQRFLRALHPLQVVELPRQKPDAALQLFAPVAAHTRILVVGGDGSVAWVLSTLEDIRASQAAAGNPHWKPPPVAVLPLGTGNDLARCLGWGAGHGMWRQEGVATMLSEVQHAAPLHIDRWNVAFAPPYPEDAPAMPRGKLASMLQRGGSLALGGFGHTHHPGGGGGSSGGGDSAAAAGGPPPVVKQMNNYLGIGVDAKVALDFHQMREQLPFFFTSQLGNKLWYTTIGGVDIVSGHALGSSACVNLSQKLQVVCDGCPVALPADIEGLLVCNINSYMGGVDLWRNSYSLAGTGMLRRGSRSGSGGLNGGSHRHSQQSMMDGKVEIVAVYGSWHLGQLQVGLSRAVRLGQGSEVVISTIKPLPMQVDGEPFVQAPCAVHISRRGQGLVLRRVQSKPLAKMMQALSEVLEESEHRGTITPAQHHALMSELSSRLQPLLLHPA